MQVRDGMSTVVLTVGPQHSLREAARLMTARGVGAAVGSTRHVPAYNLTPACLLATIGSMSTLPTRDKSVRPHCHP